MSCGRGCSGGGEPPRNPSYIPNDPPRQRRDRPRRPPAQNEETGIGPAAPNWRPPPIGSPPGSPRSPLAASSPERPISPVRQVGVQGPCRPVGVAAPMRRPPPEPAQDATFRVPGRMPPAPIPVQRPPPQALNATFDVPARAPPQDAGPRSPPRRQMGVAVPFIGPQLPRVASPPRAGPCRPVGVAAPMRRPPPEPAQDATFRIPGRMPPAPIPVQRPPPPALNATFDVPPRAPPQDVPARSPPRRQMGVAVPFVGPQLPRAASPPRGGPCRPVGVAAPIARPPALNESYQIPGRMPPVPLPPPRPAPVPLPPQRRALNETYEIPGRMPPVPLPPPRPALNETFDMGPPVLNRTYVHAPPRFGETFTIDDSDAFADSIMDDMGDGEDWELSTTISIDDFDDDEGDDSDFEPSFENVANSTPIDDEPCLPCGGGDDLNNYFPDLGQQPQLDDIGPEVLYDSGEYLDDVSPPEFADITGDTEDSSLGLLPEDPNDDLNANIYAMAEAPSNISVYDAEGLNITTAPRNLNLEIPRNRIWQNLMNSLNEIDNAEDLEYDNFVAGIQEQRRDWIQSFSE